MSVLIFFAITIKLNLLSMNFSLESLFNAMNLAGPQKTQVMEVTREFLSYYRNTQMEMDAMRTDRKGIRYSPYATEEEFGKITNNITALNIEREQARLDYFFLIKDMLNEEQWEYFIDNYSDLELLGMQGPPGGKPGEGDRMPEMDDADNIGGEGGKMPGTQRENDEGKYGGMQGRVRKVMQKLGVYSMLDLSNDQKSAIKDILNLQLSIKEEADEAIETRNNQIKEMQNEKYPNKEKILSLIIKREEKKGEIEKVIYSYDLRIMQLLTLNQRKDLFDLMMDAMRGRRPIQPQPGGKFPDR
jgi:Spy/CpxP family protein refolding chaperone